MSSLGERVKGITSGLRGRAREKLDGAAMRLEKELSARRSTAPKTTSSAPRQPMIKGPVNGAAGVKPRAADTGIDRRSPSKPASSSSSSKPSYSTPTSAQRRRNLIKALQPRPKR